MQAASVQTSLDVNGSMDVAGPAAFGSNITVDGTGNFGDVEVAGTTTTGALVVDGASELGTLSVSGDSSLNDTDVQGSLTVAGAAGFGDVTAAAITTGDLRVTGDLMIEGSLTLPSAFSLGELEVAEGSRLNDLEVTGEVAMQNGGSSFTLGSTGVQVATGGGAKVEVTETSASLTHGDNGITAQSDGTTKVVATQEATVSGGGTMLALSDRGASLTGTGGAPVRLSGIADGVARNDAVNVGQLNDGLQEMSSGIAMSMAMSQLPSPLADSNYSLGMALGGFNGQGAMALGGTAMLSDNLTLRGAVSHSGGNTGAGVGVGWSF